jgi:ubiquinone/menaquinone biosynthesis C-methylase UbiE
VVGDRHTTRAVYDATADQYAQVVGTEISEAFEAPLDRELLASFVDELGSKAGTVVDLGTGVGRVAAFLTHAGVADVIGIDLSTQMLRVAHGAHPDVAFGAATLAALPVRTAGLDGAVSWYSIIHTAVADLDPVIAEIARVLRPGRPVLFGFQAGRGEAVERPNAHGTELTLTSHRHDPDAVAALLQRHGFAVVRQVTRPAALPHETTPQAFILARSPAGPAQVPQNVR